MSVWLMNYCIAFSEIVLTTFEVLFSRTDQQLALVGLVFCPVTQPVSFLTAMGCDGK